MQVLPRKLRELRKSERGSELVEFAFTAPILLALVFGILDFSRAMYCDLFVNYAAQEGARYAIVRGASWSGTSCSSSTYECDATSNDVKTYVKGLALPWININDINVNSTWPGTTPGCSSSGGCSACATPNTAGCYVNVNVTYRFKFIVPFLPKSTGITFSGTSQKVIQE